MPTGIRVIAHTPFTGAGGGAADVADAIASFTKAFNLAMAERKKLDDPDDVLTIFVAPEWTFKKAGGFFTYGELGQILEKLNALSKLYPAVIIFAGSILWAITGKEETGKEKKFNWSKFKFDVSHFYKETLIVYNTTPVLLGGLPVHFYHKQFEGLDVTKANVKSGDEVFAFDPGEGKGAEFFTKWKATCQSVDTSGKDVKQVLANTFTAEDLLFGIEICADHGHGPVQKSGKKVDVQILISCGAKFLAGKMSVRDGGIAIHCDGNLKDGGANLKAALTCFKAEKGFKEYAPKPTDEKKAVYGSGVDGRVVIYEEVLKLD